MLVTIQYTKSTEKFEVIYDNAILPNAKHFWVSVEEIPDGFNDSGKLTLPGRVTYAIISYTGSVLFRTHDKPERVESENYLMYTWSNPIEF